MWIRNLSHFTSDELTNVKIWNTLWNELAAMVHIIYNEHVHYYYIAYIVECPVRTFLRTDDTRHFRWWMNLVVLWSTVYIPKILWLFLYQCSISRWTCTFMARSSGHASQPCKWIYLMYRMIDAIQRNGIEIDVPKLLNGTLQWYDGRSFH